MEDHHYDTCQSPGLKMEARLWLHKHIMESRGLLLEMESYAQKTNVPIIRKESLVFIQNLLRVYKPKQILEIGTGIGYSAIGFCQALEGNCSLTTIELNEKRWEISAKNIGDSGYSKAIRLIQGDALLAESYLDRQYDMVFLDAAKGQYLKLLQKILPYITHGGMVLTDNIFHGGRVFQEFALSVERRQRTAWRRLNEYADYLTANPQAFSTSFVPLGDGVAMTVIK